MREAIGGTWLFTIVIVFIVLFSSYLAFSVNYAKAFKVKNSIISTIEYCGNLSEASQIEVSKNLNEIGYYVYSNCESSESPYDTNNAGKAKYCVSKKTSKGSLNKSYYKVRVFFRLDLPILGEIFTFPVTGETKALVNADDISGTCARTR